MLWAGAWRNRWIWPLTTAVSLALAILALAYGAVLASDHSVLAYLAVVLASLVVDLAGIGMAVVVLDRRHQQRTEHQEKRTLIEACWAASGRTWPTRRCASCVHAAG